MTFRGNIHIPTYLHTQAGNDDSERNNKNHLGNSLNPCFSLLIQNNRFVVNIPRGDTFIRGQKSGPENKFHARKP